MAGGGPKPVSRRAERRAFGCVLFSLVILAVPVDSPLAPKVLSERTTQANANLPSPPAAARNSYQPLERGKWFEGEISPGQVNCYRIQASAGQYFSIEVEHWGPDLAGAIFDPTGQVIMDFSCNRDDVTARSVITNAGGEYTLTLHPIGDSLAAGRYEVRLREIRPKEETDKKRTIVEKALADGEQLRRDLKKESNQQALEKYREALAGARIIPDRVAEANALKNLGKTYEALNQNGEALENYNTALAVVRKLKDPRLEGDIRSCRSDFYVSVGDNRQALADATVALQLSRTGASRSGEARALFASADALYSLGK